MVMPQIAVLTSGGDAPGMNTAIRAVTKVAASRGIAVYGVVGGYTGLLEGSFRALTHVYDGRPVPDPEIDAIGSLGGTILGSARELRFLDAAGRAPALERVRDFAGLIVIGGNGSLAGAHALAHESAVPVVGMPASIDNDVGCSASAIGVDTALNTIVAACDKICDTARAHRRAFVVEVMGRDCGYLAMAGAIAAGADAVLFREQDRDDQAIVDSVERAIRSGFAQRGKPRVLILKAEGVSLPCTELVRRVEARLGNDLPGVDVRATVLGHLVRGGSPSFHDRLIAGRLGLAAVAAVLEGATDVMVGWQGPSTGGTPTEDNSVSRYPLELVLRESAALVDGSSAVTKRRVQLMERVEGVLGL
ncbi:MAG: ATP-dependent 6-phosphofructokinase [Deltaproteobacteria bacterium]|nr:ATP-dependent 6-phosphofructokinase [Nannocystaceae bacterium]